MAITKCYKIYIFNIYVWIKYIYLIWRWIDYEFENNEVRTIGSVRFLSKSLFSINIFSTDIQSTTIWIDMFINLRLFIK